MNISKRSEYGLRALLDLAENQGADPVPLFELAERNNLPQKFLEQILPSLRNAGIVSSQLGPGGGYSLGRGADEITFGEVVRILDGTLAPVSCVSKIAYEPCTCPDEGSCRLKQVMEDVRKAIIDVVDQTTLSDAVNRNA